jgi:hypothetical protein
MWKGMFGYMGRAHLEFGTQIEQFDSIFGLVDQIDKQIITNYKPWPSNYFALRLLENNGALSQGEDEEKFFERYKRIPNPLGELFLEMYANPVINKRKYAV